MSRERGDVGTSRFAILPAARPSGTSGSSWTGQAVSLLGDQFHFVALAWLVLDLTGSGLALGGRAHGGHHPAGHPHRRRRCAWPTASRRGA